MGERGVAQGATWAVQVASRFDEAGSFCGSSIALVATRPSAFTKLVTYPAVHAA